MDLNILRDTPPWDWPEDADREFLRILRDDRASASDRMIAAELAGDFTVVNDEIANALLSIASTDRESEELRARGCDFFGTCPRSRRQRGIR